MSFTPIEIPQFVEFCGRHEMRSEQYSFSSTSFVFREKKKGFTDNVNIYKHTHIYRYILRKKKSKWRYASWNISAFSTE